MKYFKNILVILLCCTITFSVSSCGLVGSIQSKNAEQTTVLDKGNEKDENELIVQTEPKVQTEPEVQTSPEKMAAQETTLPDVDENSYAGSLFLAPTKEYTELNGDDIATGATADLKVDVDSDGNYETFHISRGSPNVTNALAVVGDYGINTVTNFDNTSIFDENGDIYTNNYLQMTCYDLDNDGIKELIVSAGDKLSEMETLVYFFDENEQGFFFAGLISGHEYMYFKDGIINVPNRSEGTLEQYTYSSGSITQIL